ncbi:MAG: tetratricopeptide repeat protein [Alphaproteobacteria bacterium]|jgi:Flp pilus assembly protein TadD/cell division septation protein DedD|nr:tetratricopeptide repeat protein [Alphaproteobacteria bacterium]MDP6874402.1 tetratricopeptide repeat protein [Alphaproteobacteria bacterium]
MRRVIMGGAVCLLLAGCETGAPVKRAEKTNKLDRSLYQAAESFEKRRDHATAVSYYRNLYRRDPGDIDAVVGLSRGLRHLQQAREAQAIILRAMKDRPKQHDLRAELGKVQLALGEPLKAIDTLSRVDSENDGKRWDIKVALAIGHDRVGLYEQAERRYRQALALSPENAVIMNNFALSLAQAGRLEEALDILERAAALPEATPRMRQNLAFLYAMKGDLASAEKYVRRDLPPDMADQNMSYYRQLREGMEGRAKETPLPAAPALSKAPKAKPAGAQATDRTPPQAEIVAMEDAPETAKAAAADPEKSTAETTEKVTDTVADKGAEKAAETVTEKTAETPAEEQMKEAAPEPTAPAAAKLPAETAKTENTLADLERTPKQMPEQKPEQKPDSEPAAAAAKPEAPEATAEKPASQAGYAPSAVSTPAPHPAPPSKADTPAVEPPQAVAVEAKTTEEPATADKSEAVTVEEKSPPTANAEPKAAVEPKMAAEPKVAALRVEGYRLQLGSFKSFDGAEALRRRLLKQHADLLQDVELMVETVTVPERGDFFRVNSQPVPNREMVDETCLKLAIRDVPCLLVTAQ